MRGLLPQKVGKTMATIQDVSTGVPFFLKTARMHYIRCWIYPHTQNFLIICLPKRNDDSFSLVIAHKNIWRGKNNTAEDPVCEILCGVAVFYKILKKKEKLIPDQPSA